MSPLFLRNGKVELELSEPSTRDAGCPYCSEVFPPPEKHTPVNEIGQDYRNHLASAHPIQDHDLRTTRWRDGIFIRCEPWQPEPRLLRSRKEPRRNHGLQKIVRIGGGEPESDDEWASVVCRCGWQGLSVKGTALAWHELRVHYRNDYRLVCPHCGWYHEDQDRQEVERMMAQHIGTGHPDHFPWGYR